MRNPNTLPTLVGLLGCAWLATAAIACGGPAEPANSATDAPDASAAGSATTAGDDPAPKWDSTSSAATSTPPSTASAGGTSGGASMGSMPTAHRTDVYDKEATEIALKRAALQVKKNCGQAKNSDGKAVGPWGTTQVQVTLGHNGHTRGATVAPPFDGAPSGNCVIQAFSLLSFPPWDGPDTTIPWDVELVQPAK
jgi:hypothetical protein